MRPNSVQVPVNPVAIVVLLLDGVLAIGKA